MPVVGELCPLLSQATDEGPMESGQRLLSTCCMPGFGTGQEVLGAGAASLSQDMAPLPPRGAFRARVTPPWVPAVAPTVG